jgi:hypothetical protein
MTVICLVSLIQVALRRKTKRIGLTVVSATLGSQLILVYQNGDANAHHFEESYQYVTDPMIFPIAHSSINMRRHLSQMRNNNLSSDFFIKLT